MLLVWMHSVVEFGSSMWSVLMPNVVVLVARCGQGRCSVLSSRVLGVVKLHE